MIASKTFGWLFLAVWLTWLFALQARLGGGPWTPDLGLVLAVAVLAHLEEREGAVLAVVLALSRSAISPEPAVAVLAGSVGLVLLGLGLRSVVELTGPLWRAAVAGMLVLAFDLWLAVVQSAREGVGTMLPVAAGSLLAAAFTSALLALVAGPLLARLPGLSPLRSRRW